MIARDETQAYSEMCAAVREVVESAALTTLVGYTPELRYADVVYRDDAPKSKVWLRFTMIQAGEKRRTLARPARATHQGMADIQLFVPTATKNAAELGRKVAALLLTVYSKHTPCVDFVRGSIKDMPREDAWFYKRVSAEYCYDILV